MSSSAKYRLYTEEYSSVTLRLSSRKSARELIAAQMKLGQTTSFLDSSLPADLVMDSAEYLLSQMHRSCRSYYVAKEKADG